MSHRKIHKFSHCAFCHFRSLGIVISAIGLSVVVIAFIADVVSLYRAEKALGRHEIFLPFGLILLYASIAVMAPKGFFLTPTICALRRFLPGTIYLWFFTRDGSTVWKNEKFTLIWKICRENVEEENVFSWNFRWIDYTENLVTQKSEFQTDFKHG